MIEQEGYIKFSCDWNSQTIYVSDNFFKDLNLYRTKLHFNNLIGVLPDGIGYGNISIREKEFIISGSATGEFENLGKKHFARVTEYSIKDNWLKCEGSTKASSESLSHAVIYKSLPDMNAVIHIHHKAMWEMYIDKLPTTNKKAEYGTPEMADSIEEILKSYDRQESGIIIMGGHKDGIISFGKNLLKAYNTIDKHFKNI